MEGGTGRNLTALMGEITFGWELTRLLVEKMDQTFPEEARSLVQGILGSWEKAMALAMRAGEENPMNMLTSDEPVLANDSPRSGGGSDGDTSKKRKIINKRTTQVRVRSGAVLEGAIEDGFSWRKYGQKDILGATYPRGYYRCTHRMTQGCMATKQVQRSDKDPTIFDVIYRGEHTCEQKPQHSIQEHGVAIRSTDSTIKMDGPNKGTDHASSSLPSINCSQRLVDGFFATPRTLASNHHHLSTNQASSSTSDVSGVVLAATSMMNSPIIDLDFGLEHVEFDTSFLDQGLFSDKY